MGFSVKDWQFLAKSAEDSGADMIECNYSCPNMTIEASGAHVSKTYHLLEKFTEAIKKVVKSPVIAKLTPNITDINIPARYAKAGGADGISAINTVAGISSIDLSSFVPSPNVAGLGAASGHSGSMVKPVGLKMVSDLAKDSELNLPISGIGGIETWIDAVEYLSVGASNVQLTTAVITYGYRIIEDLIEGLMDFLSDNQFDCLEDLKGVALDKLVHTAKFDLSQQGHATFNLNKCIGCGRCYIACQDAGSGKLGWDCIQRKPEIFEKECFSCMSCQFVCPVENLIKFSY
jgi:dihydropyrimidine dehydrogenase (NAD+) subunit PreA